MRRTIFILIAFLIVAWTPPATADVRIQEWGLPTPGSFPHDPAVGPDGSIWYTESGVEPNTIVRFDPKTGKFSRWSVPSGGGVIRHMAATPKGEIYIACSGVNKVGIVRAE